MEDFPRRCKADDIARAMNTVGFTTAKSWLKPYHVLSNGEKMRVDLARTILEEKELAVFDEYTSVIDRKVAKVGSFAVQKAVRRLDKKFIAVSCHEDILEWLEPDWVFCTDDMQFTLTRGKLRRPKVEVEVYEVKGFWPLFKKYHYMNYNLLSCSSQYVAFYKGEPIAFCAITPLVHNTIRKGMRMHRLVVMPDYQGVGIGAYLFDIVAEEFYKRGYRVMGNFTHPALVALMVKNKNWQLTRSVSHAAAHAGSISSSAGSVRRLTTGWEYKSKIYKRKIRKIKK